MFGIIKIFYDQFVKIPKFLVAGIFLYLISFGQDAYAYFWGFAKTLLSAFNFDQYATILNFDGLAGWMVNLLRLPECFQIILSGFLLKFMVRKIPFLKW